MKLARKLTVLNEDGICARPAGLIVRTLGKEANGHEVTFEKDGVAINPRSMMALLTLEGHQEAEILVTVEGSDARRVLDAITGLFNEGFHYGYGRRVNPIPASHRDTIVIMA